MLNKLNINDWKINHFIIFVIIIQLTLLAFIALDFNGFKIPILREIIGFIFLTFLPGFALLRILKLHNIGIRSILYAIGSSIVIVNLTLTLVNYLMPFLGFNNPLSLLGMLVALNIVLIFLLILSYLRDKNFIGDEIALKRSYYRIDNYTLFILILPFISIIGTFFVNYYHINLFLFILYPLIAIVPILFYFNKLKENRYPLILFSVALALIFSTSLINTYIWGADITIEYYLANLVVKNNFWNNNINENVNAMLSVVMLSPIYSKLLGMSLTCVFKVIIPFLFCFVPLGLYEIYKNQLNSKIAFLASLFFVFYSFFYFNAPSGVRQEIVELFLVLLVLVLTNENLNWKYSTLLIFFILGLVTSHYGTSYIFILIMLSSFILINLTKKYKISENDDLDGSSISSLKLNTILIIITIAIAWYIFNTSSSNFYNLIRIINDISSSIFEYLFVPEFSQGMSVLVESTYSFSSSLEKYINILAQGFLTIGLFYVVKFKSKFRISNLYLLFALSAFFILVCGVFVPLFSNQIATSRLYHLCLFFLSPFVIIGILKVINILKEKSFKYSFEDLKINKLVIVFLIIFLLFNTTWIYGLFDEYPHSIRSLSLYQEEVVNGPDKAVNDYFAFFPTEYDVYGVNWLSKTKIPKNVYTDTYRSINPFRNYASFNERELKVFSNLTTVKSGYVFLSYFNTKYKIISGYKLFWGLNETLPFEEYNLIYNNGGSNIFMVAE